MKVLEKYFILMALACTLGFTACSDDVTPTDDTTLVVDGLEAVKQFFYETDASGEDHLVRGVALDTADPTELSVGVADEEAALKQFYLMAGEIDATYLVQNSDDSYTLTLTDTLGNVYGTALYTTDTSEGVLASITFSPTDLIPGVSRLDFIAESLWPDNETVTTHVKGNVINVSAPVVKWTGGVGYLSSETKTVPMVCVNTATQGNPAIYVYFDTWNFSPKLNRDLDSWSLVEKYLPDMYTVGAFTDFFITHKSFIWVTVDEQFVEMQEFLAEHGVELRADHCYYDAGTSSNYYGVTTYHTFCFSPYSTGSCTGGEAYQYPYILAKRVAYNETWNGEF
ncbi:MAG: hypothetical protein Q4D56_08120 [Bacteroides sp.]|nr:hypothetical protein [Bacteroides sp.]